MTKKKLVKRKVKMPETPEEFKKLFSNVDSTKFWEAISRETAENTEAFRRARARSEYNCDCVFYKGK